MTTLRRLVFACLALGCCSAFAQEVQPPLYSFADLYRLTVSASPEALALVPAAAAQPHVTLATQDAFSAIEPRFTVSQVPASKGWMLLVAGLLAASWVAHRRLTSAY
jgi:hypothetical protein